MGAIDNIPATKQIGDKFLNTEYDAIVAGIKENREAIATAASGFQGDISPTDNFVPANMPKGYYKPTVLGASYGPTGNKYLEVPENPDENGDSYIYQVANNGVTISLAKTIVPTGEFITNSQKNAPNGVLGLDANGEAAGYAKLTDVDNVDAKIVGLTNSDTVDIKSPTVNGYVTDTGSIVTSTSWLAAVDRPVSDGDIIHYEGVRPNQAATAAVIGKKSNGDIIIILDNQPSPGTDVYIGDLTVPTGVVTITACARNIAGDSFMLTRRYFNVKSDKVEGLDAFKNEILGLTIEAPSGAVDIKGETQGRILNADGTLTVNANWSYMPPRAVSQGDIIRYYGIKPYGSTTTGVGMIGRDASNNITVLIPKHPNTNTTPSNEYITIPTGIVTIEACARNLAGDQFLVQKVTGFEMVIRADKVEGHGKKTLPGFYLAIGDSITAQDGTTQGGQLLKGYQQYIMEVFSFSNGYYNGGFSGHSLSSSPVPGRENDCIVRRLDEYPVNSFHKYVTVLALTNDFRLDCVIGDTSDFLNATGDTTVYGAFRVLIDYIYEQDTKPVIVFITPFQRNNSGYSTFQANPAGNTLIDYIDAMLWVAKRMSIPVIDLMNTSGINEYTIIADSPSVYLRDGLHPNNEGYKKIGGLITNECLKYFS